MTSRLFFTLCVWFGVGFWVWLYSGSTDSIGISCFGLSVVCALAGICTARD